LVVVPAVRQEDAAALDWVMAWAEAAEPAAGEACLVAAGRSRARAQAAAAAASLAGSTAAEEEVEDSPVVKRAEVD